MKRIKEYFSDKTGEQIFSLCLLIFIVVAMLFCAIVRLCGGLWFTADLDSVHEPSQFWQDRIMNILFAFELTFVYKILCRTKWIICILIAVLQTILIIFIPSELAANIINLALYFIIPICFNRNWFSLLESAILYALQLLYSVLFLVSRIGILDTDSAYNFIYNVLGTIDYKLFIVALYLLIKYFGGIKLWKKQKRLIFQTDLRTKKE